MKREVSSLGRFVHYRNGSILITLILLLVAPVLTWAQEGAGTGTIQGRVRNQLTGRYLNSALVEISATGQQALTNEFGDFRITGVPSGQQTLTVFYTGLDLYTQTVTVQAGQTSTLAVNLSSRSRLERESVDEEVFELAEFTVASTAADGSSIAINEQRFAGNITNVVSSDEFGDVTEGNVGEFIKYLPGVSVEYVAADIRAISVRGLGDSQTVVTFDGNSMASAASGSETRRFELEQVSINNVARVELVKVPTPDMRADSLGGAVNMVSRSAFERDRAEFRYRAYASINDEDITLKQTPGPKTGESYKIRPGIDFNYINPLTDDFGFVLNGLYSNQFNEQHRSLKTYRSSDNLSNTDPNKNPNLNPSNPYLQDYTFQDGPKTTLRESLGTNIDWRPAENWVVSAGLQWNYYDSFFGNRNLRWRIDRSSPYQPVSFSPTGVQGPNGAGEVLHGNSFRNKYGRTIYGNLKVKYYGERFEVEAGAYYSDSTGKYDDMANGHFERVQARARNVTIAFDDINDVRPQTITTIASDGSNWDYTDLSNYEILDVRSRPVRSSDTFTGGDFDLSYEVGGPWSMKLKTGIAYREQNREIFDPTYTWNFSGINGNRSADLILDDYYVGMDPHFGLEPVEYPSPFYALDLFRANPSAFTETTSATAEADRDIELTETITSAYLMGDWRMISNKLRMIAGVRFERTEFDGIGPLAENGTTTRRGAHATGDYDDFFPSIHLTYDLTGSLLMRLAYAKTISRPNWNLLIPRNAINENETGDGGSIEAINGNLEPWMGDNFDFSIEYYTQSGGILSAGVFYKKMKDMWENYAQEMTVQIRDDLGLSGDPRFAEPSNWDVETTINGGDAEIVGFEFEVRQKLGILGFMGDWGDSFQVFANATFLDLKGGSNTDFSSFVETTGNWGVTFDRGPVELMVKWNYRGKQQREARTEFPGGFRWYDDRLYLDINFEYEFMRELVFFMNARNVTNTEQVRLNYSDETPSWARVEQIEEFGVQLAIGFKGTF